MEGLASERSLDLSMVTSGKTEDGVQRLICGKSNWLQSIEVLFWSLKSSQRWRKQGHHLRVRWGEEARNLRRRTSRREDPSRDHRV